MEIKESTYTQGGLAGYLAGKTGMGPSSIKSTDTNYQSDYRGGYLIGKSQKNEGSLLVLALIGLFWLAITFPQQVIGFTLLAVFTPLSAFLFYKASTEALEKSNPWESLKFWTLGILSSLLMIVAPIIVVSPNLLFSIIPTLLATGSLPVTSTLSIKIALMASIGLTVTVGTIALIGTVYFLTSGVKGLYLIWHTEKTDSISSDNQHTNKLDSEIKHESGLNTANMSKAMDLSGLQLPVVDNSNSHPESNILSIDSANRHGALLPPPIPDFTEDENKADKYHEETLSRSFNF